MKTNTTKQSAPNKQAKQTKVRRSSFFYIGGAISAVMTLLVVISFFWTPYSPTAVDASAKMQPPSAAHLLGTDNVGRDIFSRVLQGAGTSFVIAICVVLIGCFFGVLIGALCGYYGGVADAILTRICDSITAFPAILLALVIVSIIGGGAFNIVLALGILFIPSFARIVRSEFARVRSQNYIQAARLMGAGDARIIFRHILPNTIPVLLPAVTIGFNNAILSEASMSFLGIGIMPPQASLGSMMNDAQTYLRNAPWYAISTGVTIALLILGFSLLSEGLQQSNRRA
ncbi:MAG: ABC transporter permease [Oscillospiraceae bacterium]|nr:ABC transporter permease [Oscillospiraceae bacterium]